MLARNHILTTTNIILTAGVTDSIFDYFNLYSNYINFYYFLMGAIFGSVLPDIDDHHSNISRKTAFITLPFALLKHRTLTHNLFLWLLIFVATLKFTPDLIFDFGIGNYKYIFIAIPFGAILHILEDSITQNGLRYALKPLPLKLALLPAPLRFRVGGAVEMILFKINQILMIVLLIIFNLKILDLI